MSNALNTGLSTAEAPSPSGSNQNTGPTGRNSNKSQTTGIGIWSGVGVGVGTRMGVRGNTKYNPKGKSGQGTKKFKGVAYNMNGNGFQLHSERKNKS